MKVSNRACPMSPTGLLPCKPWWMVIYVYCIWQQVLSWNPYSCHLQLQHSSTLSWCQFSACDICFSFGESNDLRIHVQHHQQQQRQKIIQIPMWMNNEPSFLLLPIVDVPWYQKMTRHVMLAYFIIVYVSFIIPCLQAWVNYSHTSFSRCLVVAWLVYLLSNSSTISLCTKHHYWHTWICILFLLGTTDYQKCATWMSKTAQSSLCNNNEHHSSGHSTV